MGTDSAVFCGTEYQRQPVIFFRLSEMEEWIGEWKEENVLERFIYPQPHPEEKVGHKYFTLRDYMAQHAMVDVVAPLNWIMKT